MQPETDEGGRMGRGRQKAKQTRIARKLKYLTTDTDYDELQKELSQDPTTDQASDPFREIDQKFQHDREMDEYAQWAAEVAAKAKEANSSNQDIKATPSVSAGDAMRKIMLASKSKSPKSE